MDHLWPPDAKSERESRVERREKLTKY
jgi:hypothetical protein